MKRLLLIICTALLLVCATASAEKESDIEKEAKAAAKNIFENHYRKPDEKLMNLYSVRLRLVRITYDENGEEITTVVRPEDVRAKLREWIYADQRKAKDKVQYTLPAYTVEDESVVVKTVRIEMEPHTVTQVTLRIAKDGGSEWQIVEDTWKAVTR
jgi:hypothetical protein